MVVIQRENYELENKETESFSSKVLSSLQEKYHDFISVGY